MMKVQFTFIQFCIFLLTSLHLNSVFLEVRILVLSLNLFALIYYLFQNLEGYISDPASIGKVYTALGKSYTVSAADNFR